MAAPRWIYKVRWSNPYTYNESSGLAYELAAAETQPGQPAPAELQQIAASNPGYTITLGFDYGQRRQWTPEAKGRKRQANMKRRIQQAAPLFADELIARELAERPSYFNGQ